MSSLQGPVPQRWKWVRRTIVEGVWLNGQVSETLGDLTFFVNGNVMFHGQAYGPRQAIHVTLNQGAWRAVRPAGSRRLTVIAGSRRSHFEFATGPWTNTWYEVAPQVFPAGSRGSGFGGPRELLIGGLRLLTCLVQWSLIALALGIVLLFARALWS